MNVINLMWALKLKRFPDNKVKKIKAMFCACCDQQLEGIDLFETCASVMQLITVRLMLILDILFELKSKQGDVMTAFLHADLGQEKQKVSVKMLLGFW